MYIELYLSSLIMNGHVFQPIFFDSLFYVNQEKLFLTKTEILKCLRKLSVRSTILSPHGNIIYKAKKL